MHAAGGNESHILTCSFVPVFSCSDLIHQQSLIRDEIAQHSSPLDTVSSSSSASATAAAPTSLRGSIDTIATSISSLSLKLNQELLQLGSFESTVTEQYREGEQAQRHVNKMLMAGYPTDASKVGAGGAGILSSGQVRVGGSGVSLNEQIYLPSAYHWSKLQEFVNAIHALDQQVAVVEEYLATSQAQATQTAQLSNPQSLTAILHAHHSALVGVTGRISQLHDQVGGVRDKFTAIFGREGERRLEEERKKEQKKREGQSEGGRHEVNERRLCFVR